MSFSLRAQTVIIPRDGFPYCEPFTNSSTRANTVFDGVPTPAFLTGGSGDPDGDGFLRLTNNNENQRGYVFIDLPFSSAYGIKVSFEYFAYGGITATAADGISFFMFDGEIGPSDFQIGGLGGSLGYSSWRNNAGTVTQPGLKGGYIGIGFDAFRNFGNEYEGRFGGFRDASATGFGPVPDPRQYYNSIAIRGPETTNYQFIDGKRTNDLHYLYETQPAVYTEPIDINYYLWSGVASPLDFFAQRFTIGSTSRAETCAENGYRKVFIDLAPVGGGNYTVTVDMLINTGSGNRLVNIFNNVPYNFPAFTNLKMGFAASTGSPNTNFHEIRNVTAQVSDYSAIPIPEIENLEAEVCEGESNLFEFDVTLTSQNSFVRCVQLFENDPGVPDNSSPVGGDPALNNCGLSNVCIEKCDPNNNSITLAGKGTFTVELDQLTTDNFDIERFEASVRFEPVPGFVGTAEIFYQVLDNYGLLSFPKTITVISNPYPVEIQQESIEFPTCDGQSDGRIFDLIVGDLVTDFDYEWFFNGASIGKSGATNTPLTNGQSSFTLEGINIGTYTLSIWNPSDNGRCETSFDIIVNQENGTPVELEVNDQIICEGQDVTFNPIIDPVFGSDSGAEFFWYLSADRSGGPIIDGSTRIIDGQSVSFQIINEKQIIISDLVPNGNNFKDYKFFVEAKPATNPSGNFCPFLGNVITEARVRVFPPIEFSASKTADDWCLDGSGIIIASVSNPSSAITYSLLDENGIEIAENTSGSFPGLTKGDYEVFASSASPVCTSIIIPITIEGPDQPLTLTAGPTVNAFCNDPNGELQFDLSGGNTPYKTITINGNPINNPVVSGNTRTLSGLSAGTYTIIATDDKDCQESVQITITGDQPSVFATTNDEICEGETATVSPQTITQSSSIPTFTWYYLEAGNYIQINNGTVVGGVTFSIDGVNNLSVSGLAPQATPHVYYLEVDGSKVCPQGYLPATILVNPAPKPTDPVLAMVSCNGGSDGSIQAQLAEGNLSDFQFGLIGNNGVNIGLTSNSGLFSGLPAGTYELTVRGSGGCQAILPGIIVSEPPILTVAITSKTDATCIEDNGQLAFTLGGGTPDASGDYQISINGADITTFGSNVTVGASYDFTVTNLAPGNYLVEVEDANGCSTATSEIIQDTEVPVFAVQDVDVCEGQPAVLTPEIVTNSIGAIPVYNWAFEDPQNPGQYIPIQSGDVVNGITYSITNGVLSITGLSSSNVSYTYYLTVSGSLVCPAPPLEAEVRVLKIPKAVFQDLAVSCFNGNDGQIQLVSVDPSGPNTYTIVETGQNNTSGNFTGLTAGTYTVRVQESGSPCFADFPVTIIQPDALVLTTLGSEDPTCGESNGQIVFEIAGGTPDYEIQLNGNPISTYATVQTGLTFEVSDLPPGDYDIEVTDANGCILALPNAFSLIDDQGIPVNMNPIDEQVCFNESAVLTPVFNPSLPSGTDLKWFKDQGTTEEIVSSPNPDPSNVIYQIDGSGVLTVQNLIPGQYTYYLEISGPGICTKVEAVNLEIFPEILATFDFENVSCFGGNDGSITLTSVDPSGLITYTLVETGVSNTTGIFNGLNAGNYTVRAQEDGSPCTYDFPFTVSEPDELLISNPLATNPTCGESNGSIQFDLLGGTPDYVILVNGNPISDFSSSINGSIVEIKNLPPAAYSVTVSDANGCEVTESNLLTLVNDDGVEVNMNPLNDVVCIGASANLVPTFVTALPVVPVLKWYKDASLTQSITNGADANGVEYQINPANGELSIQGLQIGDYTYYVEISGPGICSKIETATVEVFPEITATIDVENVVCFGETNGSIQVSPTGGNGNFEISLNGSPFTNQTSYLGLAPGGYTVSIRNDVGCLTEIDVEVLSPTEAISINDPTIIRASCGLDNGSISDLVITGGWGNYAVEWRKGSPTGVLVAGTVTGTSDLAPDTYYLLIEDAAGCSEEFSFLIGESSDPVYAVVPPINACTGNSVEIRPIHIAPDPSLPPAAATEVRWYFGPNQSGLIQNGPDSSLPGVTYTIDDSDWLNPELLVEGLPSGTYTYYFYVVCTGQEIEVEVIAFDTPEVELETDAITCFGDSNGKVRVISGADPSYTYSVNGGAPLTLSALEAQTFAAGNYNLVVATPAGCAQDLTFIIDGPSAPLTSSPLNQIDPGCGATNGKLILTVTGGWAPYSIEVFKNGVSEDVISTSETNITLDGFSTGVYKIEITDGEGCVVATNEVTLVDGPTQVLVSDGTICEGEVATLTPTLDPATNGSTFQWFFDQALTQPINSSSNPAADGRIYEINSVSGVLTITGLPQSATPISYYVTASGASICPGFIGEGSVIVGGTPTATAVVEDEVCFGDGGRITVNATGGSGNYTYSLNGGGFSSSNIFDVEPGMYSIEVMTQEGCSFTLNDVQVMGPAAALIVNSLVQDNASCGLDNGEVRFTIEGGYVPYSVSYSKNGTTAGTVTSTDGQVRFSNLGLGSYAFTITDVQGCELVLSNSVTITEVPTSITANGDQICEGETAELLATVSQNIPDPQFIWSFDALGNNLITSGDINGVTYKVGPDGKLDIIGLLDSGSPYTYYVTATGTGVCGLTPKPVTVTMNPIANLKVSNPSVVCDPNGKVDLTDYIEGFNPTIYDYNVLSPSGSAMQINEIENVALSGDYRVSSSFKGSNCWNQPQRIRVLIADAELIANFQYEVDLGGGNLVTNGDVQIEENVQFQDLTQGNAILWNWDFGDGSTSAEQSPVHQFLEKGTFTVILSTIDDLGCQSEFQIIVNVFDDYMVMVPNAFTPDGTKNQFFKPQFRGIASMEFYIFNTWGELIYQANSLEDAGWDGTLNGVPTPNGNYVYRARFVTRSGESIDKSGVFILIR